MSEPQTHPVRSRGGPLERTREEILAAAKPLPPPEDMLIEDLTEDESRRFLEAIADT